MSFRSNFDELTCISRQTRYEPVWREPVRAVTFFAKKINYLIYLKATFVYICMFWRELQFTTARTGLSNHVQLEIINFFWWNNNLIGRFSNVFLTNPSVLTISVDFKPIFDYWIWRTGLCRQPMLQVINNFFMIF